MSFRCRQKLRVSRCTPVISYDAQTLETGEIVPVSVDLCREKLPDADLFDLATNIKAGVNLEEQSSRVLRKSNVSAERVLSKILPTPNEPNKNEVNNED